MFFVIYLLNLFIYLPLVDLGDLAGELRALCVLLGVNVSPMAAKRADSEFAPPVVGG